MFRDLSLAEVGVLWFLILRACLAPSVDSFFFVLANSGCGKSSNKA